MHFFEPLLCTFYLTNTFNLEYDRAIEMSEKAIRNKCNDAAYDLGEIYLLHKSINADRDMLAVYKQYSIRLIRDKLPLMSEEYRKKSEQLLLDLGISL